MPGTFQNIAEMVVEMLDNMIGGVMGKFSPQFRNYIGTIFIFILLSNISGLFGLRPPTADYGVTLPLGIMTFTLIHFNKFRYQKVKGVIAGLCDPWPIWAPINVIGDVAVPISLSLRLFANVLSGTVMMALIYGLVLRSNSDVCILYVDDDVHYRRLYDVGQLSLSRKSEIFDCEFALQTSRAERKFKFI